jgi:hypothetical protein
MYETVHYPEQDAMALEHMREMKRMGIDYVARPLDRGDGAAVKLAEELGMGIMAEYNDDMTAVLDAFRGSPALFAHISSDDVDLNKKWPTPQLFAVEDARYRAAAPNLLTLASVSLAKNSAAYFGIADKTGQQCYPIGQSTLAELPWCYERMRDAATAKGRGFVAHVQTSRWKGKRYPTPEEFYVMAWGAVILGAQEILFYTYYDYDMATKATITDLTTQPNLRAKIKEFILKLRELEPFFLFGKRISVVSSSGLFGAWDYPALNRRLEIRVAYSTKSVSIVVK